MMRPTTAAAAALLLCLGLGTACRTLPEDIAAIEAENELLREQIQALRERCQQGRELELRPEVDEDH